MEWNKNNIDNLVKYINMQLKSDRSMKDIENNDFNVNERVITKRLNRLGYKKIDNQFVLYNNSITIHENKPILKENNDVNDIISMNGKEVIQELYGLIEPMKEVIQAYNDKEKINNSIEVDPVEIKIDSCIGNLGKAVGVRIDENIYKSWCKFTADHKQFKSYQLLSQALLEYMKKYK